MVGRLLGWIRRHKARSAGAAALVALAGLNGSAYLHARAMTHFTRGGVRTPPPDALTFLEKVKTLAAGVRVPRPRNHRTPASAGLPFATHHFLTRDGVRLEAWRVPRARSRGLVVLFPGYAAPKATLIRPAALLRELGLETFLVDFRGTGGSSGQITTVGYREALDVAAAVRHAARFAAGRVPLLYGQSMGAAAVLRAVAEEGVKPAALILEAPFDRLLATVANRFHRMGLPAFPFAPLLVFWGGVQHGFNGFAHNPVAYATCVTCPTLLLQGDEDTRVTLEQARSILDHLGGPKTMKVFAGCGHRSLARARGRVWQETVARFLQDL